MKFLDWLLKDAEPKITTDRGEVVSGAAARLRQNIKNSEEDRKKKAEEWWENTKNDYLQRVIRKCEELSKQEKCKYSMFIDTHEGFWFPEFKTMLRKEGFRVEDGDSDNYITISW